MSILNVNTIQPIGSGTTVTVAATELKTSNFITVGTGASVTSPSANVLTLGTNSAERLRITSAGLIGIGTVSPSGPIHAHVASGTQRSYLEASAAHSFLRLKSGSTSYNSGLEFFSGASNIANVNGLGAGGLQFEVNGSERVRISATGNLGIGGLTNPGALLSIPAGESNTPRLAIESAVDDNDFTITQYEDGNGTYTMLGQNVKLNSSGNNTILDSGHRTAGILLDARNHGAITFLTGGTNSVAEPVRIESNGRVAIGGFSGATHDLHIKTASSPAIRLEDTTQTTILQLYAQDSNAHVGTHSSHDLIFNTNTTERLRITSAGHVLRPTMAAAAVTLSAGQTTLSTFNTSYQSIALDSEGYDNANNFNTSNYRFTAPETGYYQVGCNVQLEGGSGSNTNNWMYLYPIINGSAPGTSVGGNQADFDPTITHYYNFTYTTLLKLSQNDYVEWKYRGNLSSVNLKGQGETVFYFYHVG